MASRISSFAGFGQVAHDARRGVLRGRPKLTAANIPKRSVHALAEPGRTFDHLDMQGKVFAVTGGARGLGLAMAEALAEAGAEGN